MALNQITQTQKRESKSPLETFSKIMDIGTTVLGGIKDAKSLLKPSTTPLNAMEGFNEVKLGDSLNQGMPFSLTQGRKQKYGFFR